MKPLRIVVLLGAVLLVLGGAARGQFGPAAVYLEPARKQTIRRSVELIGTAEARRSSTLGAEVAGRVETMLADEGDYVQAGAPVCTLNTDAVAIQLRGAEAQSASSQAELKKMEDGYRPEEIVQAEARHKAARASLDKWQQEFDRTKKLFADGASTSAEMESVEASFRQAREGVAEAEASLKLLRSGFRQEDVDKARADLGVRAAAVDGLKDTLRKMTVRMPFNGFVTRKVCEVGEWLLPGSPVVEVVDLDVVRVELNVPERYVTGVRKGDKVPVVFEGLGGESFEGVVSQIVPVSAEATHTVAVRVDVANAVADRRPTIAAGLVARAWLPVGESHEAMLVPKDAVIRQRGQDLVYTVSDEPPAPAAAAKGPAAGAAPGAAQQAPTPMGPPSPPVKYAVAIPIRLLQGYGEFMEVESERLKDGMLLVTRGTYLLAPGAPVEVRPKEEVPKGAKTPEAAGGGAKAAGAAGGGS